MGTTLLLKVVFWRWLRFKFKLLGMVSDLCQKFVWASVYQSLSVNIFEFCLKWYLINNISCIILLKHWATSVKCVNCFKDKLWDILWYIYFCSYKLMAVEPLQATLQGNKFLYIWYHFLIFPFIPNLCLATSIYFHLKLLKFNGSYARTLI